MDARWMRRIAVLLLLGGILSGQPAHAREECPFLRDPAYWASTPVAPATRAGFTIGTLNVYRLFDDEQDGAEHTRLTTPDFTARITRIARYIARDMGGPAAIGLQEVEDDTALRALAIALARETGRPYDYLAGDKDDDSDIRSALLYDARLRIAGHRSLFAAVPGEAGPRFDRLPLVADVDAGSVAPGMGRVTLVVVHLKSQRGIDRADESARVLEKRRVQAARLAAWVAAQPGARLVVLGDFNAPVLDKGAARSEPMRVLLAGGDLVDVAGRFLAPSQRWTYRYRCTLQELDHLLVSPALAPSVRGYAIARGDTCLRARETCSSAHSISDHEGVVLRMFP